MAQARAKVQEEAKRGRAWVRVPTGSATGSRILVGRTISITAQLVSIFEILRRIHGSIDV